MYVSKGKCYLKRKRFLNEISREIVDTLKQIYCLRNQNLSETEIKDKAKKYALTIEAACLTPKYKMSNDEYHRVLITKTRELCDVLSRTMIPSNFPPTNSISLAIPTENESGEREKNIKKPKSKKKENPSRKIASTPKLAEVNASNKGQSEIVIPIAKKTYPEIYNFPTTIVQTELIDQKMSYNEQHKNNHAFYDHLKTSNFGNMIFENDVAQNQLSFALTADKESDLFASAISNTTKKDPFDFAEYGFFDTGFKGQIEFEDSYSFM